MVNFFFQIVPISKPNELAETSVSDVKQKTKQRTQRLYSNDSQVSCVGRPPTGVWHYKFFDSFHQ